MEITIKEKTVSLKYSFRALMIYENITREFSNKIDEYYERLESYEALDETDEEIELQLELNRIELMQEDYEIDMLYRMIPTEYAADEFSARFFMTYL